MSRYNQLSFGSAKDVREILNTQQGFSHDELVAALCNAFEQIGCLENALSKMAERQEDVLDEHEAHNEREALEVQT